MDVLLPPEMEKRIAEKLDAGLYANASEMVTEGLRMLLAADEARPGQLRQLEADIRLGVAQLDRAEYVPGDSLLTEISAMLGNRRKA